MVIIIIVVIIIIIIIIVIIVIIIIVIIIIVIIIVVIIVVIIIIVIIIVVVLKIIIIYLYLYLGRFPQFGGSRQHRRNNKTMGISLRSSGNNEGPSRVWMALLEQHSPSSPVFHNFRRFIYAISPTAPTTGLPL